MPSWWTKEAGFDGARVVVWALALLLAGAGGFTHLFGFLDKFYLGWEASAILATAVYCAFAFFIDMLVFPPQLAKSVTLGRVAGSMTLAGFGIVLLGVAFFASISRFPVTTHAGLLTAAALAILLANLVIGRSPVNEDAEARPERQKEWTMITKEAMTTVKFCDVPTVLAMVTIAAFVVRAEMVHQHEAAELRSFVGGAVAFQLLVSNAVFGFHFVTRFRSHIQGGGTATSGER